MGTSQLAPWQIWYLIIGGTACAGYIMVLVYLRIRKSILALPIEDQVLPPDDFIETLVELRPDVLEVTVFPSDGGGKSVFSFRSLDNGAQVRVVSGDLTIASAEANNVFALLLRSTIWGGTCGPHCEWCGYCHYISTARGYVTRPADVLQSSLAMGPK